MRGQAERRRAACLGIKQRRTTQMIVARRARPHRRQGHEVRQIERMDERLADIGVHMPGQRTEPGFDRIDARSEEHTSELQSLMRLSYAVFCLKKNNTQQ